MIFSKMTTLVPAVYLSAGLLTITGCTGKNTFSSASTSATVSCTLNCVSVQLSVDNVQNLNYTCSGVRDVTNNLGMASCPAGSVINYFIQSPSLSAKSKIVLGSYTIPATANSTSIVRITPYELSGSTDISAPNTIAVNITRLLMSLQTPPYVPSVPVNKINITDAKKTLIDTVFPNQTIALSAFGTEAGFTNTFQPWLDAISTSTTPAIPYTLATSDVAAAQLKRGLNVIKSGIYSGSPVLAGTLTGTTSAISLGISGANTSGTNQTTMAMYLMVDRDGNSIGQGLHWHATNAELKMSVPLLYLDNKDHPFVKMIPTAGSNPHFNTMNGKVEDFKWDILTAADVASGSQFQMTTGRLLDNLVMSGDASVYNSRTSAPVSSTPDAAELGGWNITGSNTYSGAATLIKGFAVDNFLDPAVWRTIDTVNSKETYVFPLHATLTFKYGAATAKVAKTDTTPEIPAVAALAGCENKGCALATQGITILANGNIISDMNRDCSAVDSTTLKDATGTQEYRVGMVRTAYTNTSGDGYFVSVALMLSGKAFGELDGVQMGSQVVSTLAKFNVKGRVTSPTGTINLTDSSSAAAVEDSTAVATWGNAYNMFTMLAEAQHSTESRFAYTNTAHKAQGTVSAAVTSCDTGHVKP